MEDKIIHEFKIIETEDGFRIEVKGDKERIRQMGFGPFGRFRGRHRHGPGPRGRHGGHFRYEKHFGWGPPWWWYEEEAEDSGESEEPSEKV